MFKPKYLRMIQHLPQVLVSKYWVMLGNTAEGKFQDSFKIDKVEQNEY